MNLFRPLDQYLIRKALENKHRPESRATLFFKNKLVMIGISTLIIFRTIEHGMQKFEHHLPVVGSIYFALAFVLIIANIRHHFFKKKINFLESFISITEASLILIYAIIRSYEELELHGNIKGILPFLLGSVMLFVFYVLVSRNRYLMHIGKIEE